MWGGLGPGNSCPGHRPSGLDGCRPTWAPPGLPCLSPTLGLSSNLVETGAKQLPCGRCPTNLGGRPISRMLFPVVASLLVDGIPVLVGEEKTDHAAPTDEHSLWRVLAPKQCRGSSEWWQAGAGGTESFGGHRCRRCIQH